MKENERLFLIRDDAYHVYLVGEERAVKCLGKFRESSYLNNKEKEPTYKVFTFPDLKEVINVDVDLNFTVKL